MSATDPIPQAEHFVCDFCSELRPTHSVLCFSFDVQDPVPVTQPMTSRGDFLACDACFAIINANDREGLIQRAKASFIRRHGYWHADVERALRSFYRQFWEHRI